MAGAFGMYSNASTKPWTERGEYDKSRYKYNGYQGGAATERSNLTNRQQTVEERTAPQMSAATMQGSQLNQHAANETRGIQMGSLAGLQSAASGAEPSRAEIAAKQAGDRSARAQVSAAGTVRGGPGAQAAAYRAASQGAAQNGADIAAGVQAGRADEMATARGQLAGASAATRGLDLNAATTNAQLEQDTNKTRAGFVQDTNKANMISQQQTTAANDARAQQYENLRQGVSKDELEANLKQQDIAARYAASGDTLNTQTNQKNADRNWNVFQTVLGAGQGVLGGVGKALSDPSAKEPIAGSLAGLGLGGEPKGPGPGPGEGDFSPGAMMQREGVGGTVDIGGKGFASAGDIQAASSGVSSAQPVSGMVGGGGLTGGNMGDHGMVGGAMSDEKTKEPAKEKTTDWLARSVKDNPRLGGLKSRAMTTGGTVSRKPGDAVSDPSTKGQGAFLDGIEDDTKDAKPYERDAEVSRGAAGAPRGYSNGRGAPEADDVSWSKPDTWGSKKPAKDRPDVSDQAPGTDDWNRYGGEATKKTAQTDWSQGGQDAKPAGEGKPGVFEALFGGLANARPFGAPEPRDTATSDMLAKSTPADQRDIATSDPKAKTAAFEEGVAYSDALTSGKPVKPPSYYQSDKPKEAAKAAKPTSFAGARTKGSALTSHETAARDSEAAADATFAPNADGSYNVPTPLDPLAGSVNLLRAQGERHLGLGVAPSNVQGHGRVSEKLYPEYAQWAKEQGYGDKTAGPENAGVVMSDERTKDGFSRPSDEDMADAMRSMDPAVYAYKGKFTPPDQKPGEVNVGPMANEMAEDPVARTAIVRDGKSGMLAIDKTKAEKVIMGSLAALQHQVDDLENDNDVPRAVRAKKRRHAESDA